MGLCAILGNHLDPFHGLFQEVDAIGFMCNIWSCQELIKFNLMMSFEYRKANSSRETPYHG